jgi:SWI/SNF-related matrix-associated actin-dependent regulator 1 of chromatin subfamily A
MLIDIKVPRDIELRQYQQIGVEEILLRKNVLLGDDMGLGKTAQVIVALNTVCPSNVLIVCPKSLCWNWFEEFKHFATDLEYWQLDETFTVGSIDYIDTSRRLLIVSYETVARFAIALGAVKWSWLVFDEFHYIKNVSSKRYKGVVKLVESQTVKAKNSDGSPYLDEKGFQVIEHEAKILGLTGSPIVNFVRELFPLINILDKKTWWSASNFLKEFTMRDRNGARNYARNGAKLQQILRETIMIRRLKKDVLPELPAKQRQVIEFPSDDLTDLLDEEKKIFEGRNRSKIDDIADKIMEINASGVVEGEINWEELIKDLKYDKHYFFEEMARVRHLVALAKLPQVKEHIEDVLESHENGEKLVIFAHHRDVIEELQSDVNNWYFKERNLKNACTAIYGGSHGDYEKQQVINEFQNGLDLRVIVGGLKVIGHGFNMTRSRHCIFAEFDWVPSTITQAEDRLHRFGQEFKILVQHLTLKNSMDALMAKRCINKQKQMDKVLNREK